MKAIINGKRYSTENAVLVGEVSHGARRDFHAYTEGLYKTPRSGAYFLAGEGGPRSHYAVSCGQGEWRGGEKITPLDDDDALAWAEKNLTVQQVEAEFSASIRDA